MSHKIVKLFVNDDGEYIPSDERVWHYSFSSFNTQEIFCSGECFGFGESGAKYLEREVKSGGITCQVCLNKIKQIKKIKC